MKTQKLFVLAIGIVLCVGAAIIGVFLVDWTMTDRECVPKMFGFVLVAMSGLSTVCAPLIMSEYED